MYLVNDPAFEEFRPRLSLSVKVESYTSVTTDTKVIVHCDDLCTPLQSQVAAMLYLNLPPGHARYNTSLMH